MVPVRKRRHAKLPDFDEAHKSTWYNLEVNKRSHFLFNYSNHWSLHRLPDLPLESKWQILLLLPHETFQVILARGHQWWSWWASETHGNRCILQKGRNYVWYRFPSRVLWSPFSCQLHKASRLLSENYSLGKCDSWGKNSFHGFLTFDVTPKKPVANTECSKSHKAHKHKSHTALGHEQGLWLVSSCHQLEECSPVPTLHRQPSPPPLHPPSSSCSSPGLLCGLWGGVGE